MVIVLGMHRSGTSCLTGLLQQGGLELGDVIEEAPHNKKGNRESPAIMALNNDVLSYSNGSWDSPPENLRWKAEHEQERARIIALFNGKNAWGFKDPRSLLTLPFWLEGLGASEVTCIATFRHPLLVAKSLRARQPDFTIEKGLALWNTYNAKLLDYHKRLGFPVIDFDLEPAAYLRAVRTAMQGLNLPAQSSSNRIDFFEDVLRHQNGSSTNELPEFAALMALHTPLYARLKAISVGAAA